VISSSRQQATSATPLYADARNADDASQSLGTWKGTSSDYTTAVVGNHSMHWIKKVVAEDPNRPFFAYIAPKAAHEPFNPAPWYLEQLCRFL